MKSTRIILTVIIIGAVALGVYVYQNNQTPPVAEEPAEESPADKAAVEAYVRQNISVLSPEPEVLGGTFYVTDIAVEDGRGVVSYEDGHIALTAEFTYTVNEETGEIVISSFVLKEE